MFPDFKREKSMFFLFTVQISSKVQSCFICGPINLKFGGEVLNSLIFILNGGDWGWNLEK